MISKVDSTSKSFWLDLLTNGTSRNELEAQIRQAHAGQDPEDATAGNLALQLFDQISAQSQQGRELAALNVVAARLAEVQGMSAVLREVVAQSRELLGVDVAYLMLRDTMDPDTLRIEVVSGSMGSILRGIELNIGEGLAGEILRTGMPKWVENYSTAADIRHINTVAAAARSEHLGGMLGVPLRVEEGIVGVLIAAERRSRHFDGREVELLARLAAHGAIAVRNARLLDDLHVTLDELRHTNKTLKETLAQRSHEAALRETLTQAVAAGSTTEGLAQLLSESLSTSVSIIRTEDLPFSEYKFLLDTEPERGLHRQQSGTEEQEALCVPVTLSDGCAGWLVSPRPVNESQETSQLLEIGATFTALVISHERTLAEAEMRSHGELLHSLMDANLPHATINRRALNAKLELSRVSSVAVLRPYDGSLTIGRDAVSRLAQRTEVWSGNYGPEIVILASGASSSELRGLVENKIRTPQRFTTGIASCQGGVEAVRHATTAARQTALVLEALEQEGQVALATELGLYRGLLSHAGRGDLDAFIARCIGPVLQYDDIKQRDLTKTLATYLDLAQHHAKTCSALHIHTNTLYQRLDRISELLGENWRNPERAFEIHLALRLRALSKRVELN